MPHYEITLTRTISMATQTVHVEAEDEEEARELVAANLDNGEYDDWETYDDDIEIVEVVPIKQLNLIQIAETMASMSPRNLSRFQQSANAQTAARELAKQLIALQNRSGVSLFEQPAQRD